MKMRCLKTAMTDDGGQMPSNDAQPMSDGMMPARADQSMLDEGFIDIGQSRFCGARHGHAGRYGTYRARRPHLQWRDWSRCLRPG